MMYEIGVIVIYILSMIIFYIILVLIMLRKKNKISHWIGYWIYINKVDTKSMALRDMIQNVDRYIRYPLRGVYEKNIR